MPVGNKENRLRRFLTESSMGHGFGCLLPEEYCLLIGAKFESGTKRQSGTKCQRFKFQSYSLKLANSSFAMVANNFSEEPQIF